MVQGQPQVGVSLKPSEAVAGGLIDQANLLVQASTFLIWDYGRPGGPTTLAVKLDLVADDDTVHEQYFSAGDQKNFVPSADGKVLVPVGQAAALNENTNFMFMLKNLINAGFPENRIGSDITFLNGLYAFWRRVNAPERVGLAARADGRPATVLVPTQIHNLPWEATKRGTPQMAVPAPVGAVVPGTVPSSPPNPSADGGGDVSAIAEQFVVNALVSTPTISMQDLATAAFQVYMTHPQRAEIVDTVYSKDFIQKLAEKGTLVTDGVNVQKLG